MGNAPLLRHLSAVGSELIPGVLQEFSRELHACRQRAKKAKTLLIVVDADEFSVLERKSHLLANPPMADADPLIVLIPCRHIETWICAATKQDVNESDDYKRNKPPKKSVIRDAAATIHGWAHNNPPPPLTCALSLISALPEWRKIV